MTLIREAELSSGNSSVLSRTASSVDGASKIRLKERPRNFTGGPFSGSSFSLNLASILNRFSSPDGGYCESFDGSRFPPAVFIRPLAANGVGTCARRTFGSEVPRAAFDTPDELGTNDELLATLLLVLCVKECLSLNDPPVPLLPLLALLSRCDSDLNGRTALS